MADMNIEYINPFLMAATQVMKDVCQLKLEMGKPYVKPTEFEKDSIVVSIGITGQIRGQVLLSFNTEVACDLASKMCFMEITQLDDISVSALSELGNMIMGNAATLLSNNNVRIDITPPTLGMGSTKLTSPKGIIVDITPPAIIQGDFRLSSAYAKNICIPLSYGAGKIIEVDVSLKEA